MRSRKMLVTGLFLVATTAGVLTHSGTRGQAPPKDLPPAVLPPTSVSSGVIPATAAAPAARPPAPIDRFRKYNELPDLTRELVFATTRGMEWLSRDGIHQPSGRFIGGVNPALGKVTDDDNFIGQTLGAFALARAGRLTGEEKYTVRAAQTILALLVEVPKDSANPAMRKPVQPNVICNRVAAAAHLALAIYELPEAAPELVRCGEELCEFLRSHVQPDGSIRCTEAGEPTDPAAAAHGAAALAALARSHQVGAAAWKQQVVAQGLAYYRKDFRAHPEPAAVPWLMLAAVEAHLATKDAATAEFAFEMADWLRALQYDGSERSRAAWAGGFPTVEGGRITQSPPTVGTAYYAMALADACRLIRHMERPDAARYDQYQRSLAQALQFVSSLQYGEENTQHFAAHFRPALVGAFHPSATDGNLRTSQTAVAVAALSQFLIAGADR